MDRVIYGCMEYLWIELFMDLWSIYGSSGGFHVAMKDESLLRKFYILLLPCFPCYR